MVLFPTLPTGIAVLVGNDLCPDTLVTDVNVVTRAQAALLKAEKAQPDEVQNLPETVSETHSGVMPDVTCEPDIDISSLFADSAVDKVDRAELILLQQHDHDLPSLFDLVDKADGITVTHCVLEFWFGVGKIACHHKKPRSIKLSYQLYFVPSCYSWLPTYLPLVILELLRPRIACYDTFIGQVFRATQRIFAEVVMSVNG